MFSKKIDTKADIHDLIAFRWSGRAYDPDRLLSKKQLVSLLEAARWAPSCYGDQPWRFIVFNKATNKLAWDKAIDCLSTGNRDWAIHAPLLLLAASDSILSETVKPNRWGQYDTGAAVENLCLQATAIGLMAHQMGGFDLEKARQLFNIPQQFTPMTMISVGYQLPEAHIPENMKEREYKPRMRDPIADNFFDGSWGAAIKTNIPVLPETACS